MHKEIIEENDLFKLAENYESALDYMVMNLQNVLVLPGEIIIRQDDTMSDRSTFFVAQGCLQIFKDENGALDEIKEIPGYENYQDVRDKLVEMNG